MWQVEVLDFDEQAREKTYRVKIAAAVQQDPHDNPRVDIKINRQGQLEGDSAGVAPAGGSSRVSELLLYSASARAHWSSRIALTR